MADRKIVAWVTINGAHVPIYEGESKSDAVKRRATAYQNAHDKDEQLKANKSQIQSKNEEKQGNKKFAVRHESSNGVQSASEYATDEFDLVENSLKRTGFNPINRSELSDSDVGKRFQVTEPVLDSSGLHKRTHPWRVRLYNNAVFKGFNQTGSALLFTSADGKHKFTISKSGYHEPYERIYKYGK